MAARSVRPDEPRRLRTAAQKIALLLAVLIASTVSTVSGCTTNSSPHTVTAGGGYTRAATSSSTPPQTATPGSASHPPVTSTHTAPPPARYAPSWPRQTRRTARGYLVNDCVPRRYDPAIFSLTTSDHVHLSALTLGSGSNGVLLAHEQGYSICSWLPLGMQLAARGYHVLLFEYRNHGASQQSRDNDHLDRDVRAALTQLHAQGARRILMAGASCGGSSSIKVAPAEPNLVGLLILSSPAHCGAAIDAEAAVRRVRAPSLFVASPGDMDGALVREVRILYRASAARSKQLIIDKSGFHGTDMINRAEHPAALRATLLRFVDRCFA